MMTTYFVVQSFQAGKKGALVADAPMPMQSEGQARRRAERLAAEKAGVVAFSRVGDPDTGEFEDARILFAFGRVPSEVSEAA